MCGSILSSGRVGRTRNVSSLSIGYHCLLSSDLPALPYDVIFLITNQEERQQGEVLAHKFIFALNSPVFKSRFCGAGNFAGENKKEVKITATVEAFLIMTNFQQADHHR